jgi:outer membrane receptor protein involved in Fe transport
MYQFIVRGNYLLNNQLSFHLDLLGEGGRKAQVYDSKVTNVNENGKYVKNLGIIIDGNIGAEYRYTERISAFLQINNLAAKNYFRWYNYPVQALQIMGGVTVRF